jgi:hypothetical protein
LDRSYRRGLEIQLSRCAGFESFGLKFVNHEAVANGHVEWQMAQYSLIPEGGIKHPPKQYASPGV